jgi:hypothetical protein
MAAFCFIRVTPSARVGAGLGGGWALTLALLEKYGSKSVRFVKQKSRRCVCYPWQLQNRLPLHFNVGMAIKAVHLVG